MSQQIVILAAGKGTRMGSDLPKVLLPLHDKPVISHLLSEVKTIPQDSSPIIVVGYKENLVKETLGQDFIYVKQFDQKGTAHAVLSTKGTITAKNFIVLYGDMPFTSKESLEKLSNLHQSNNAKVSMFTSILPDFKDEHSHFMGYGRILRNDKGAITSIIECKDATEEQKNITEVNPGIYMFNTEWLWDKLESIDSDNAQQEFYLTDIIEMAITDNQQIYSLPIASEEIYGINTPEHLEFARNLK